MTARHINLYVPGILTFPGDARNWCGRAVTYTHVTTEIRAEKVEYISGPGFTRSLFQKERATKLARTLGFYAGWIVRLIAHSNGADVVVDALRMIELPCIEQLHLVCAACEADFNKNGLNHAMLSGKIVQTQVYIAEKDSALRLADTCVGRVFGFGALGRTGPQNVDDRISQNVGVLKWPGFGHSDCWSTSPSFLSNTPSNFHRTMDHFLRV